MENSFSMTPVLMASTELLKHWGGAVGGLLGLWVVFMPGAPFWLMVQAARAVVPALMMVASINFFI
jgi:hypothetical protein